MDRLTALTVFRRIVETGSLAGAGRALRLSPAAISKNLGELEAHLQVRLINRTTRRMSLTEAGTLYYRHVAQVLDDLDAADRALGPLQQVPGGTLKVAAPMTVTLVCLSQAIPRFLARFPQVSLDLNLDDRRVDVVKEGYDLAIRGSDNLEDSSLAARRLMVMRHVLCASPGYFAARGMPAAPEDLRHHECVQFTLSGHAASWEFRRGEQVARIGIDGRYKVASSLAVRDALLAGFGLSLIPEPYVRADLAAGRLQAVLDDWTKVETSVYAIYPSRRYLAPALRAFLDFITEEFRAQDPQRSAP